MSYFVFNETQEESDEGNVYVTDIPEGLVRQYQLLKGMPRVTGWPSDVAAKFSDMRKEGMLLTDKIANPLGWLIVSDKLKQIIETKKPTDVEYLPLKMRNHKKKVVSDSYWIVNFTTLVEAVDRAQSKFEVDAGEDDKIFSFNHLVLRPEIESKGPLIFRLKEQPMMILARADLAELLLSAGLTGVKLTPTAKFTTFPVPT